ncbi:MAG: hypothetical protein EOO01_34270 [Chitinophagaceae bacterium]|nr:MAG: hypothetical protein EOO01_34270 [Chitinophagaceae bacterium]
MKLRYAFCVLGVFVFTLSCNKSDGEVQEVSTVPKKGLYQNGVLSTGTVSNSGVSAPGNFHWSELQNAAGNDTSNVAFGYACHYGTFGNYRLADDFIIPSGEIWKISKVSVYVMSEGNVAASPFDALRLRIWKGEPSQPGATVVYGDLTTNVLRESIDSLRYVIANSVKPSPGVAPLMDRKVWKLTAATDYTLSAGTYWLEWQTHGISGLDFYSPTVKIKGARALPSFNTMVYNALNVWQATTDQGNPGRFPGVRQDTPFEVEYTY